MTTNLKDGIKSSGKTSEQGNINLSPKSNDKKAQPKSQKPSPRPATRIDIDGTLTGKKVVLYVQTGNVANVVIGTIITMGSFWVVMKVEKTNIPYLSDVAYINKSYIVMYIPIPEGAKQGGNQ